MPDPESAQHFDIVTCATTQLLHILHSAGHIWSQGGHRSNLMTDSESVQNFSIVMCATTQFLHDLCSAGHSWSQDGHTSNLMPDSESAQNFGTIICATTPKAIVICYGFIWLNFHCYSHVEAIEYW